MDEIKPGQSVRSSSLASMEPDCAVGDVLRLIAYTLLELSDAAEALALVARTEHAVRSISTHGWTDAEAARVAVDAADHLRIAIRRTRYAT